MTRKVCIVTGTRAEYGLLRALALAIRETPGLQLQLLVTGSHLSPEFGLTYREIEADGLAIDAKVEMLLSADTASATAKSMGLGMIGFGDAFERLRPDLVLLLGDRFEILAAASAALVACVPVAHLHGGETTEGAFDESIRHAVTKMAHLHFVAAADYRRRVIQLGESPDRVFQVGGLGVDAIQRLRLLDRATLEQAIGFALGPRNLLVTFHPVTLEAQGAEHQMRELLAALDGLADTHLIFTMPNADSGSRVLARLVDDFVATRQHARAYASLGQLRYLSCLQLVDGVVGNSSSGLIEAPTLGIGTVNIGDRQRGRLRAPAVIDCAPERGAILAAIGRLYTPEFRRLAQARANPYGQGGAVEKIVHVLQHHPLDGILKKSFHDLDVPAAATP
ncbi:MAG: UDP-N-acetylglucosamine 2-epimerase [Pseudomonadota bacterium]